MSIFHNDRTVMRIVSGLLFAGAVLLSLSIFRSSELFSRLFDFDPETELIPKAREILAGRGHDPEDFSYTVERSIAENLLEYVQEEQLGFDDASALPYFRLYC